MPRFCCVPAVPLIQRRRTRSSSEKDSRATALAKAPPQVQEPAQTTSDMTSLQGLRAETTDPKSEEFKTYNTKFGGRLVKLYRLVYNGIVPRNLASHEWSPEHFFHGTGHCGCLNARINDPHPCSVAIQQWCGNSVCAVNGILNHGMLLSKSPGGR